MGRRGGGGGKGGKGGGGAARHDERRGAQARGTAAGRVNSKVAAQQKRLARALAKAGADAGAALEVHLDGARAYAADRGFEWCEDAAAERLTHLLAAERAAPADAAVRALRGELIIALLDDGRADAAREMLESDAWKSDARTDLAYSRALIEFVALHAGDSAEEGASQAKLDAALDAALKANVYCGVFLANLSAFTREVDPARAAEARAFATQRPERYPGSAEEALAYCGAAAGAWMDFIESGIEGAVAARLAEVDQESIVWPPVALCVDSRHDQNS
eukprot:PRCOL_00006989-RA